jgi:hypothetical protein
MKWLHWDDRQRLCLRISAEIERSKDPGGDVRRRQPNPRQGQELPQGNWRQSLVQLCYHRNARLPVATLLEGGRPLIPDTPWGPLRCPYLKVPLLAVHAAPTKF